MQLYYCKKYPPLTKEEYISFVKKILLYTNIHFKDIKTFHSFLQAQRVNRRVYLKVR